MTTKTSCRTSPLKQMLNWHQEQVQGAAATPANPTLTFDLWLGFWQHKNLFKILNNKSVNFTVTL